MNHAVSRDQSAPDTSADAGAHLMVAEDDPEMRRLIERALGRDGHQIAAVGSGLQLYDALRVCHQRGMRPDLIVSDIRMPGMGGLQVVAALRAWGWVTPVLLITAFGDEDTLNEAARLGSTMVFSKPFDLDDLRTAVMCLLEPHDGYQPVRRRH